jgi:hypothetical protein
VLGLNIPMGDCTGVSGLKPYAKTKRETADRTEETESKAAAGNNNKINKCNEYYSAHKKLCINGKKEELK